MSKATVGASIGTGMNEDTFRATPRAVARPERTRLASWDCSSSIGGGMEIGKNVGVHCKSSACEVEVVYVRHA